MHLVSGVWVSVRGVNILIDHKLEHPPGQKINSETTSKVGVASHTVKSRVIGLHNGGAVRVNKGVMV